MALSLAGGLLSGVGGALSGLFGSRDQQDALDVLNEQIERNRQRALSELDLGETRYAGLSGVPAPLRSYKGSALKYLGVSKKIRKGLKKGVYGTLADALSPEELKALNIPNLRFSQALKAFVPVQEPGGQGKKQGLVPQEEQERLGQLQQAAGQYFGGLSSLVAPATQAVAQSVQTAQEGAKQFGQESLKQIEAEYNQRLNEAIANLTQAMTARGLGTSTAVQSGVASAIVPNAIQGLLGAKAAVQNAMADRLLQSGLQGAGILAGRFAQQERLLSEPLRSLFSGAVDIPERYFQTQLGLATRPIDYRMQTLVQPSQIYALPYVTPQVGLGSAVGGALSGLGAGILGRLSQTAA